MEKRTIIIFTLLSFLYNYGFAQIPEWYEKETNRLVGVWVADNSQYVSDQETDDAYAIQWKWGEDKESLTGILYGLQDGKKTNEYWTFIQFWDDDLKKVRISQSSAFGTVGEGYLEYVAENETRLTQTFTTSEGQSFEEGHITNIYEGYEVSTSYSIVENVWEKKRSYKWINQL